MQYWPDWSCHWNYDEIDRQYCKSRHFKCWKELEYALRAKWVGQIVCDLVPLKSNWKTVSTKLIYIILWAWHTKYLNGQCGFIIYFVNCNLWISVTINGWGNGGRQLAQLEFTVSNLIDDKSLHCRLSFINQSSLSHSHNPIQCSFVSPKFCHPLKMLTEWCWRILHSAGIANWGYQSYWIEILWAGILGHLWDMVTRY